MHTFAEIQVVPWVSVAKGLLHVAEEAASAGNGDGHGPELAQDTVPAFDGDTLLCQWDVVEDLGEAEKTPGWQGDSHGGGVNEPTQDDLAGRPRGVPLEHLLDRRGLTAKGAVLSIRGTKYLVDGIK